MRNSIGCIFYICVSFLFSCLSEKQNETCSYFRTYNHIFEHKQNYTADPILKIYKVSSKLLYNLNIE